MTRGFYEQIGVASDADLDEIRAAYARAVAHLLKRREATVQQQGDPSSLDLRRAELDEAWDVLSDPARRRRYDAMLAVVGDGVADAEIEDLWSRVAGAMVPPATAAAVRVVDALTGLALVPIPEPPRPEPPAVPTDSYPDAVTTRVLRDAYVEDPGTDPTEDSTLGERLAAAVVLPDRPVSSTPQAPSSAAPPARPAIRLPDAPPPITMGSVVSIAPPMVADGPVTAPGPTTVDVEALVDVHGFSGALVRAVRDARGLTLQDLSSRTSITVRYFEAIEREDLSALPTGMTYLRGYLRKTAELLGLDAERFVEGYIRRVRHDE